MGKKQKNATANGSSSSGRKSSNHSTMVASSSKSSDDGNRSCSGNNDEEPIRACLELTLKPPTCSSRKKTTTSDKNGSNDNNNGMDDKYIMLHHEDAYKMDIRDGEAVLIVRSVPSSLPSSEEEEGERFVAAICNVRISPSPSVASLSSSANNSNRGTPLTSKKTAATAAAAAMCGEIISSSISLYEHLSSTDSGSQTNNSNHTPSSSGTASFRTPPPTSEATTASTSASASSSAATAPNFTSPSKSKFSFSKGGGGGDALLTNNYTPSPSKSKFSFAKGGGGDSFLSPSQGIKTTTPGKGTPNATQLASYSDSKQRKDAVKVIVVPLIYLSNQIVQRVICPDVKVLQLCPVNEHESNASNKSLTPTKIGINRTCSGTSSGSSSRSSVSIDSHLLASKNVLQTMIVARYQGRYIPASQTTEQSTTTLPTDKMRETISIPFRGQMQSFHIVNVTPSLMPSGHDDDIIFNESNNGVDEKELSTLLGRLDLSDGTCDSSELITKGKQQTIATDNATTGASGASTLGKEEAILVRFIKSRLLRRKHQQLERGKEVSSLTTSTAQHQAAVAYRVTHRTKIDFVSLQEYEKLQSTTTTDTTSQNARNNNPPMATTTQETQPISYCAGLDSTLNQITDAILPPLLHPNLFPNDGPLRPPKGALLFGPAGVGKSLLARQIAHDLEKKVAEVASVGQKMDTQKKKVYVRTVQCADILSSTAIVGEAERLLTDIFNEVERMASSISTGDHSGSLVILDDVHLICPRRGGMGGSGGGGGGVAGVDQLAGTLLALLDGIGSSSTSQHPHQHQQSNRNSGKERSKGGHGGGGVVVLAITTDPSLLDPALRRPGRLDVEVEVPVPDDEARSQILKFHLSQLKMPTANKVVQGIVDDSDKIKALARLAKGFTGADCKLAVKEAVRTALSRHAAEEKGCDQQTNPSSGINISYADLEHAIRTTKPSAIQSVAVEVPHVPWSAIGGMNNVKSLLRESIELPLTHPRLFEMMRVPPPKGILLYGPPGCSKTLMARAIATEGQMNFLAVKGPELLSKWLGESERALASLFRRARLAAPSVIFFDEMDAIASKRGGGGGGGGDRLLSQLLTELDGVTTGGSNLGGRGGRVVVVGASNRPDVLDAALTRPGRMDRMIYVGLPDEEGRKGIFQIGLSGKDCHDDVDVHTLASDDVSKGYTGAEIIALCRDAALHAIGEMDDLLIDRPQICMRHLLRSIKDMKPRTTKEMLLFYESFRGRH